MAIINKEPYITPEMIAAWNNAGSSLENIITREYAKTDFAADGNYFTAQTTENATVNSAISAAKRLMLTMYGIDSQGQYTAFNSAIYDMAMFPDSSNNIIAVSGQVLYIPTRNGAAYTNFKRSSAPTTMKTYFIIAADFYNNFGYTKVGYRIDKLA